MIIPDTFHLGDGVLLNCVDHSQASRSIPFPKDEEIQSEWLLKEGSVVGIVLRSISVERLLPRA